jgi:predicted transposase/invertase (TIGR01784 family)
MTWGNRKYLDNTKALLKACIDLPDDEIDSITLIDPFLPRLWKRDKLGIVDLKALTKIGKIIHVELQARKDPDMRNRILYYAGKLIYEQIKQGDEFRKINRTICVVICDHELLAVEEDYKNQYFVMNQKSHKIFTDVVEIITVELPKVPDTDNGDPLWPFLKFFKCREEEDFTMLTDTYRQVRGAFQALRELSMSPYARRVAYARWKESAAQEAREEDQYNEGIVIGKNQMRARADAAEAKAEEERRLRLEAESRARELERRVRELGGGG